MLPYGEFVVRPPYRSHAHRIVAEAARNNPRPDAASSSGFNPQEQPPQIVQIDRSVFKFRWTKEPEPVPSSSSIKTSMNPFQSQKRRELSPQHSGLTPEQATVVSEDDNLPILKYTFVTSETSIVVDTESDNKLFVVRSEAKREILKLVYKPENLLANETVFWHTTIDRDDDVCTITFFAFL